MREATRILALALAASAARPTSADVLVGSRGSDRVLRFDAAGTPQGVFAADPALLRPVGITYGPDGHLYVAAGDTDHVVRFDGQTGASLGVFTHGAALLSPRNLNFGPDGAFYVADGFLNQVLRFDGQTGEFDRVFIQDPALNGPTSFTFGPDGNVYVVSVNTNQVLRYDGQTGAALGVFASNGLAQPHDVAFGPDGNLYVTNSRTGIVHRYRGDTGELVGPFVSDPALRLPLGMAWGSDGHLYVANQGGNEVRRYDGVSGASLGTLVAAGAGGLVSPAFFVFVPPGELTLAATTDAVRGTVTLAISGARPGARVLLAHGSAGSESRLAECPELALPISEATAAAARVADESGGSVVTLAAARGARVVFVAIDASRCVATAPVPVTLP